MKKLGAFLVGLGLAAGTVLAANTNTASSVNAVGFVNKTMEPNKWILATCNFQKVGGGTNTLLDVFGTSQLAQNDSVPLCDIVILWDVAQAKYQAYAQWTDGVFYKANDITEWGASIAANPEIPVGTAMWIVPSSALASNKTITLAGEVVSVATQTLAVASGWQLMGYPLTCDVPLQNTGFAASGAAKNDSVPLCDVVITWVSDHYQAYALWTDNQWYKANDITEWGNSILATNTITLGEGFWYIAKNDITLTEVSPYVNNLK